MNCRLWLTALLSFLFFKASFSQALTSSVAHIENHYNSNSALNSLCSGYQFSASYTNTMFLKQIGKCEVGMVIPSKYIHTSLSFDFYGYSEYWTTRAGIGLAHHFKPYVAIGLNGFFKGFHFSSGFKATGGLDLSILVFPTKKISLGAYARNISFSPYMPVVFSLGISYRISANVLLALEGGIELKQPFFICMDFEYKPVKQFLLRCGVAYQTTASAMVGFGLRFGGFILDFNVNYNLGTGAGCYSMIGFRK